MKIMAVMVMLGGLGLGGLGLQAQNQIPATGPTLNIGFTGTPPVIDGKADDPCWRLAATASGFVTVDGFWALEQTAVWVAYDKNNLYLAVKCWESSPATLVAEKYERDDISIVKNDCIELYFDVKHNHDSFYHLIVDSRDEVYDATCAAGTGARDRGWNCNGKIAAARNPDGWFVELAIPFVSLGSAQPEVKTVWGVNFNREQRARSELSSWAMTKSFNDPAQFGNLTFGTPDPVSAWVVFASDRQGSLMNTTLRNITSVPLALRLKGGIANDAGLFSTQEEKLILKPGEEIKKALPIDFSQTEPGTDPEWTLNLSDLTSHAVYLDRKAALSNCLPVTFSTDRYYYSPTQDTVKIRVTTKVGKKLRVTLQRDTNGKPVAEKVQSISSRADNYSFSFSTSGLDAGRFLAVTEVLGLEPKPNITVSQVIYLKTPVSPPAIALPVKTVSLRKDGVIFVNQTPFCPFFTTDGPGPKSDLAENSFNVRWGDFGLVPQVLNRVNLLLGRWNYRPDGVINEMPDEPTIRRLLRDGVARHRSDPRLFGWFICYESHIPMYRQGKLDTRLDNPTELAKMHRFIKSLDPNHLTGLQINAVEQIPDYKDKADVIEIATGDSSYANRLIPNLVRDVTRIRSLLGPQKPFLFYIGSSIPHESKRTAEEIKCAAYLALMHGVNGLVFHTGHEGIKPSSTRHWSVYPGLAREVERIFPILIAPQPAKVPILTASSGGLATAVKHYGDFLYMIACNTTGKTIHPVFSWTPGLMKLSPTVTLPFENRNIFSRGTSFADTFLAYEVHVYQFTPAKK